MSLLNATATEVQKNFGYYINQVKNGHTIAITKNGKEVSRMIPVKQPSLSDSLVGMVSGNYGDYKTARDKAFEENQK